VEFVTIHHPDVAEPADVPETAVDHWLGAGWRLGPKPEPQYDQGGWLMPATEQVPAGTVDAVLEWVGDDPERSALALLAERLREQPRTTLVTRLEQLAPPQTTSPAEQPAESTEE
jgi:hypothetical protein